MDLYRNIIYQAKNSFRDKGFLFWSLLYPIIMVTFFYIAFSGITNVNLEKINVGVEEDSNIKSILQNIEILNVEEISDRESKEKLEKEEIDGFIKKDLSLIVNDSGLNQTVIKSILDQIVQTSALGKPIEEFDFQVDYINDKDQKENGILVIFYSLIAMVSTYGIYSGIEVVHYIQSNLSEVAARINTTPIKKKTFLLAGIIVGLILNFTSNIILFIVIELIMKLDLITNIGYSLIFIILGNLFGIVFGIFIGVSNNKNINVKTMIAITFTVILSGLSGLFNTNIKIMIEKYVPILAKINPIAVITNNLYKVNLLNNTDGIFEGIIILLAYFLILSLISLVFLRRRQYDSI
ncbi:ABC transporter permease [Senegalia massiliensis]|uniref:ABC transporter permease n=1 Tax=Senegalia massiliensis TaxID=1720316 RepID=A0A845QYH9_9CLOT|nr:ABC transporter permease [Senegalia massiliensis]